MKNYKLICVLGIIVLIVPLLGIPQFFRNWIIIIIGIVLIAYSIRIRYLIRKEVGLDKKEIFVESNAEIEKKDESVEIKKEILEEAEQIEEEIIEKDNE